MSSNATSGKQMAQNAVQDCAAMQVSRSAVYMPGHLVHLPSFQIKAKFPRPQLDGDAVKIKVHLLLQTSIATST